MEKTPVNEFMENRIIPFRLIRAIGKLFRKVSSALSPKINLSHIILVALYYFTLQEHILYCSTLLDRLPTPIRILNWIYL